MEIKQYFKSALTKRKGLLLLLLFLTEIILLASGLGMVSNGSLSITILQIPVIIAAIILGLSYGLLMGAVFGVGTMIIAGGYGAETLDHLFTDPVLSLVPRLLMAFMSWMTYKILKKTIDDHTVSSECIAGGGAALIGTVTNTVLVTLLMYIFYPDMLGEGTKVSVYVKAFANIIGANTSIEICITVIVVAFCVFLLKRKELQESAFLQYPIRKTFQKWLIVFMFGGFSVIMLCSYLLQTVQARKNADDYLYTILGETVSKIEAGEDYQNLVSLSTVSDATILIAENGIIVTSGMEKLNGKSLSELGFSEIHDENAGFSIVLSGSTYYCRAVKDKDATIIGMMAQDLVYVNRNETAIILLVINLLTFIVIFLLVSKLLQDNVVEHIYNVNKSLSIIQNGNLDEIIEIRDNKEFSILSDGINETVHALKEAMEKVAAKMNQEMEFAREIQHSALPVTDQVKPKMNEYEILGIMDAAREVGGDFYDYFLIGENKLGVVIADVSGKGVPAALFMMTAKTLIKNLVLSGKSPAEALTLANIQLCENNEAGMFVTVWLGILDYRQGELQFANAGHNPPLLKKYGKPFSYMDHKTYKRSIMLGMREGIRYKNNCIPFTRGDMLYLYTDGVVEANNLEGELYGEERLKQYMDNNYRLEPEELIQTLRSDIDSFAGEAEQFDDITMVILKMNAEWKSIKVEAVYENTERTASFVEMNLPEECSRKTCRQIAVAFDEIYSNVVKYSKAKELELRLGILKDMVYLEFTDDGIPYNPLECAEPDIEASKEERPIGGLGLFVVKRTMDYTEYQYLNDRNRFTIGKKFF